MAKSRKAKVYHNNRRIKTDGGQKKTLPIKSERQLNEFMQNLLRKVERAKTEVKYYQARRNWMLCLIGFNTAFRAEDLLQLKVVDVIKGYVKIIELKTGKMQNFRMNKQLHNDIKEYVEEFELTDHDYLFRGQKKFQDGVGYTYPITRQQGYEIVSKVAKEVGIPFTFGLHSLRKTFGYMYIKAGKNPETLMKMYNHDDYGVTTLYVCWGRDDAESERANIYLGGVHK